MLAVFSFSNISPSQRCYLVQHGFKRNTSFASFSPSIISQFCPILISGRLAIIESVDVGSKAACWPLATGVDTVGCYSATLSQSLQLAQFHNIWFFFLKIVILYIISLESYKTTITILGRNE